MIQIGKYNHLIINRSTDFGFYSGDGTEELLLPFSLVEGFPKEQDEIKVFVYLDSEDRPIATQKHTPLAQVDEFAVLTVKELNTYGAFLDWGLPKDLFVPFKEQHEPLVVGKSYVFKVLLDVRTKRPLATSRLGSFFEKADLEDFAIDQEVDLLVYRTDELGYYCLVNRQYQGLLYRNEVFRPLAVAESLKGYIRKVREDGRLDLMFRKSGYDPTDIASLSARVLRLLEQNNGFLPYHDRTEAEQIREIFQVSKKQFKQTLGALYREGKIVIFDNGIGLQK